MVRTENFSLIENDVFVFSVRHSGIIIQCQPRKYLVQVEQQQYWIDFDLIRPNTILDQVGRSFFFFVRWKENEFLFIETKCFI